MDKAVEFTDFIQPICLPSSEQRKQKITGTIVGYGHEAYASDIFSDLPKESVLITRSLQNCKIVSRTSTFPLSNFCGSTTGDCMAGGK